MRIACWKLIIGMVLLAGCSAGDAALSPEFVQVRQQLLLTEEPENAIGILELREAGLTDSEVVLLGRVGGVKEPWSPGRAAFVMSDPVAQIGADHVCDGCAFCKQRKEEQIEPWAIVRFSDAQGQVLPVDARALLGIDESQTVVVRGQATVDSLGNLILAARDIYVRR